MACANPMNDPNFNKNINISQDTPFIEIIINNELGSTVILDTSPDDTITGYIEIIERALLGVSFAEQTIENGFADFLMVRGYLVMSQEEMDEIDAEKAAKELNEVEGSEY